MVPTCGANAKRHTKLFERCDMKDDVKERIGNISKDLVTASSVPSLPAERMPNLFIWGPLSEAWRNICVDRVELSMAMVVPMPH